MVKGRENIPPSVEMQKQPGGTDTGNRKGNKRADQATNLEGKAGKAERQSCATHET